MISQGFLVPYQFIQCLLTEGIKTQYKMCKQLFSLSRDGVLIYCFLFSHFGFPDPSSPEILLLGNGTFTLAAFH